MAFKNPRDKCRLLAKDPFNITLLYHYAPNLAPAEVLVFYPYDVFPRKPLGVSSGVSVNLGEGVGGGGGHKNPTSWHCTTEGGKYTCKEGVKVVSRTVKKICSENSGEYPRDHWYFLKFSNTATCMLHVMTFSSNLVEHFLQCTGRMPSQGQMYNKRILF
jgi:hypothetical protein